MSIVTGSRRFNTVGQNIAPGKILGSIQGLQQNNAQSLYAQANQYVGNSAIVPIASAKPAIVRRWSLKNVFNREPV